MGNLDVCHRTFVEFAMKLFPFPANKDVAIVVAHSISLFVDAHQAADSSLMGKREINFGELFLWIDEFDLPFHFPLWFSFKNVLDFLFMHRKVGIVNWLQQSLIIPF